MARQAGMPALAGAHVHFEGTADAGSCHCVLVFRCKGKWRLTTQSHQPEGVTKSHVAATLSSTRVRTSNLAATSCSLYVMFRAASMLQTPLVYQSSCIDASAKVHATALS